MTDLFSRCVCKTHDLWIVVFGQFLKVEIVQPPRPTPGLVRTYLDIRDILRRLPKMPIQVIHPRAKPIHIRIEKRKLTPARDL